MKGGIEKMKKTFIKKILSAVATVAMTVSMVVAPTMEAKAATSYAYLMGVNGGWDWDKTLSSTDGVNYSGTIDFTSGGDISIMMTKDDWNSSGEITSWNSDTNVYAKDGRDAVWFLGSEDVAGTYNVNYNANTGVVTATIAQVSTTVWTYEYYVAGEATLEAESWSNNDPDSYGTKGKMTKSGTTWTYTATTSEDFDGTAGYNVMKIGVPDDDSDRTIEWLKDGDTAFACAYTGAGTLTITFDEAAGTSTCTFVAAGGNNDAGSNTNTDTDSNADSNAGVNTDEDANNNANATPDTGDTSYTMVYMLVAVVAAMVVLRKRSVVE